AVPLGARALTARQSQQGSQSLGSQLSPARLSAGAERRRFEAAPQHSSSRMMAMSPPRLPLQATQVPAQQAPQTPGAIPVTLHSKLAGLRDEMKRRRSQSSHFGSGAASDVLETAEAVVAEAKTTSRRHVPSLDDLTPMSSDGSAQQTEVTSPPQVLPLTPSAGTRFGASVSRGSSFVAAAPSNSDLGSARGSGSGYRSPVPQSPPLGGCSSSSSSTGSSFQGPGMAGILFGGYVRAVGSGASPGERVITSSGGQTPNGHDDSGGFRSARGFQSHHSPAPFVFPG
ncbi:unnamed protein product, partial [Polarella glacialis]